MNIGDISKCSKCGFEWLGELDDCPRCEKPQPAVADPTVTTIGCGDSGCVFGTGTGTRYGGQHTNGGCRCLDDIKGMARVTLRKWITVLRKDRDNLRDKLAEAEKKLKKTNEQL